jgi:hypothetical protein
MKSLDECKTELGLSNDNIKISLWDKSIDCDEIFSHICAMIKDNFSNVAQSRIFININSQDIAKVFHYPRIVISIFASAIRNIKCKLYYDKTFAEEVSLELHEYDHTIAMAILTSSHKVVYVKLPHNTVVYSESVSTYLE